MLGGVGAGGQLAVHGGSGEHGGVRHQGVHGIHTLVEVVLDLVEVAVVFVGDLGGDIALGDAVHIAGGHIEGADDGIQAVIHALYDLPVVALVLGGVGAGGQLAFDGGLVEHGGISDQRLQVGADLLQGRVDLVLGISSYPVTAQVALGDLLQASHDALEVVCEAVHGLGQVADLIGALHLEARAQVALGHLLHHLHALAQGAGDGLGEDPADAHGEDYGNAHDDVHQATGPISHDGVGFNRLLGERQLHFLQSIQGTVYFSGCLGTIAPQNGFCLFRFSGLGQGQNLDRGLIIF